jgi:uncharacterized membrane protein
MEDNKLRIISLILAVIGILDSVYLSWVKITNRYALCGPIGDCESVNSSIYSEVAGIPIALLGAGAYLFIIILLLLQTQGGIWQEYGSYLIFGISLAGTLYSVYLTYLEIAVIHAICPYCVVSAIVIFLIFVISLIRLINEEKSLEHDDIILSRR